MTHPGTVTSETPRAILRECARQGVDVPRMLRDLGVVAPPLADRGFRVPIEKVFSLWTEAFRRTGDPHLPMRAAHGLPMGGYRTFDYLVFSSATLGHALQRMRDYYPLLNTGGLHFGLHRKSNEVAIEFFGSGASAEIPAAYVEYVFTAVVLRLSYASGRKMRLRRVDFAGPMPARPAELIELFGRNIRFCQPRNILLFDAGWESVPLPLADAALCEALEEHADRQLHGKMPADGLLSAVRIQVDAAVSAGRVEIARVSRELAISPRTLQRRLASAGRSFRTIVDEARWARCSRLLAEPDLTADQMCAKLHFSEPRAFHRAFRRWTGTTLRRYRCQ